jgi:hypothetical protein
MNPEELPPTPNGAGGLWLYNDVTAELTPVPVDDAPPSEE